MAKTGVGRDRLRIVFSVLKHSAQEAGFSLEDLKYFVSLRDVDLRLSLGMMLRDHEVKLEDHYGVLMFKYDERLLEWDPTPPMGK